MAILGDSYFERITIFGKTEILGYQTDNFGSIPQVVYKYLDLSLSHNRNSLLEDYLWFGDPTNFNDPFDCKVTFDFRLLAEDEPLCRKYYEFHSRIKEPNLSDGCRRFVVDQNVKQIVSNKSDINFFKGLERQASSLHLLGIKQCGVLCTSMIKDNIVLWSHYANSHTGVCLGLKVDKLLGMYHDNGKMGADEIKYDDFPLVLPVFSDDDKEINDKFQPFIFTKAPFWKYELEYRFFNYPCFQRKKPMGDILESIYMGCSISLKDESFVKEFCQNDKRNIKLYKAEKAFFKYGIKFNEIAY